MVSTLFKRRAFRTHTLMQVSKTVRREMQAVSKVDGLMLAQEATLENLEKFSWPVIVEQMKMHAPVTTKLMCAMLTMKCNENSVNATGSKHQIMLGVLYAMVLNTRHSRKLSLFQGLMSIQMYRSGGSQRLHRTLNKLSICRGKKKSTGKGD